MDRAFLVGPSPGMIKEVPLGFSWLTLFFGGFVALYRKDWKWALILIGGSILVNRIALQLNIYLAELAIHIFAAFFYNSIYIKELMKKGWKPASDSDAQAIAQTSKL